MKPGETGYLILERPWPSMLRTIYGDDERFKREYWSRIPGVYFTGDAAQCDKDGYIWVLGRVDDVIKVAGHRLSSMEIESALVSHPAVAEAAVVARPDDIKGEAIVVIRDAARGQYAFDESARRAERSCGQHDWLDCAAGRNTIRGAAAENQKR